MLFTIRPTSHLAGARAIGFTQRLWHQDARCKYARKVGRSIDGPPSRIMPDPCKRATRFLRKLWAVGRQPAPYSPELEPDIVLTEPQPRHRTPPAWIRLCTPLGDLRRWQHSVALDGSITLHLVAA